MRRGNLNVSIVVWNLKFLMEPAKEEIKCIVRAVGRKFTGWMAVVAGKAGVMEEEARAAEGEDNANKPKARMVELNSKRP